MDKILIIYWTQTGATEQMARAVEDGANEVGAAATCIKVTDLQKEDLAKYDAFIWGTGNYFQTIHGMIWDFFDRVHYDLLKMPEVFGKPYGFVVSAGVGGAMCLDGLNNRLRELKWKRCFEPVVAFHMPAPEILDQCKELGRKMARLKQEQVIDLNPPKKPRFTWPEDFRIVAGNGVGVEAAKSWTPFLTADTGMKITVTPEQNPVNRFKWTGLKLYQLTALDALEGSQMVMADCKYCDRDSGPFPVRAVWAQSKSSSAALGAIPTGTPSTIGVTPGESVGLYVTHIDNHPMMIHRLCRWFDENHAKYKDAHALNQFMNRETILEELTHTFVPAHEGLIRFMKENNLWTEAHEERQNKNVELVDRYCRAYQDAKDAADEKGLPVLPDNAEWINLWEDYKKAKSLPPLRFFKSLTED